MQSETGFVLPVASESSQVKLLFLTGWSLVVCAQALLNPSWDSLFIGFIILFGGFAGVYFFAREQNLVDFPVSSVMCIGYTCYFFIFPPIVTILEDKAVINNLDHPYFVLGNALAVLFVLVISFYFYISAHVFVVVRRFVSERIYIPMKMFERPDDLLVFSIGMIGITATAIQVFVMGAVQEDSVGAGNKFMQALYPLAFFPYCILVNKLYGGDGFVSRRNVYFLILFTVILILVSIGKNNRSGMVLGFISILLAFGYGVATKIYTSRLLSLKNVAACALLGVIIAGPVSDIATGMVIVRGQRTDISALDLMTETFGVLSDKQALRDAKNNTAIVTSVWDEYYIDDLFLSRFSNLKFPDVSLDIALSFDGSQSSFLRELELDRSLSILPRPIIDLLGLSVDKEAAGMSSGGDLLLVAGSNSTNAFGEYKTGSLFASGYGMFGWWYLVVIGFFSVITFALADAQTLSSNINVGMKLSSPVLISPFTLSVFYTWFVYFTSAGGGMEAISSMLLFPTRGWLQNALVYFCAILSVSFVLRIVGIKRF